MGSTQPGSIEPLVSIIILTRRTREDALQRALEAISALAEITEAPRSMGIEEEA